MSRTLLATKIPIISQLFRWHSGPTTESWSSLKRCKQINPVLIGENMSDWRAPDNWQKITTIDAHTGGEPFRIVTSGFPELQGNTILEHRRFAKQQCDRLRTALICEPRGHADMYGGILLPPISKEADFGVLFMHNEGYASMCGHGIIALATVAVETGFVALMSPETILRIETPAGVVTAYACIEGKRVQSVRFQNVPSFVVSLDDSVEVPGLGKVHYDLAFGGGFFAYVQAVDVGLNISPKDSSALVEKGLAIKREIMASRSIHHPFEEDLSFLYGTIFVGPPKSAANHSSNVCIFGEGEIDRSPTGTGVSGRLAIHHARGEIGVGQRIIIESIMGSTFSGSVSAETTFGNNAAIIPTVEGSAYITGRHEFLIDPSDPLHDGFILRG